MKKRVAIIIPGGIGVGHHNQGIPTLENLIRRLADTFDVTVFPLGTVNEGYHPVGFSIKPIDLGYDRSLFRRIIQTSLLIFRAQRQKRFHLFHGIWTFPSGTIAVIFGKIFRAPSIISLQGGGMVKIKAIKYGGRMNRMVEKWIDWSLRQADGLTAESHFQKNLIPGTKMRARVKVIPYGTDIHRFTYQERKVETPIRFIHIANLNQVKDQVTLIRCFEILASEIDCCLTIIGPDYLDGKLHKLVEELGLSKKVTFAGFVPHAELPHWLKQAHFMLHTSLHEGMPLVAVEAMASGVVVCGTCVGIIADLAPDHCMAVPVGDYQTLATAVLTLLADRNRLDRIRKNAYQWAQKHTIDWTADQFKILYNAKL